LNRDDTVVPTAKTIWNKVKHDPVEEMTSKGIKALVELPAVCSKNSKRRLKRCRMLALDWSDLPFYGRKNSGGTISDQRKKSTDRFHRYMTAEIFQGTFSYNTGYI